MTATRIPRMFADPYTGYVPPADDFCNQPVSSIGVEDFVIVNAQIYRVSGCKPFNYDRQFTFTLEPVAGGLRLRRDFWGRNWLPVYRMVKP